MSSWKEQAISLKGQAMGYRLAVQQIEFALRTHSHSEIAINRAIQNLETFSDELEERAGDLDRRRRAA